MKKLMPIGELFKKSWVIYKNKGWTLAGIFAPYLIYFFIAFAGFWSLLVGLFFIKGTSFSLFYMLLVLIVSLIVITTSLIFHTWITLSAMISLTENKRAKECLALAWPKVKSGIWVSSLMWLFIFIGLILVIPGIIVAVWYVSSLYVFIFEDLQGMKALKRSKELVKGYWWAVFGRLVLIDMVSILVMAILHNPVLSSLLNIFVILPFSIAYFYVVYDELKKIKS